MPGFSSVKRKAWLERETDASLVLLAEGPFTCVCARRAEQPVFDALSTSASLSLPDRSFRNRAPAESRERLHRLPTTGRLQARQKPARF